MTISDNIKIDIQRKDGEWQDILRCLSVLYGSRVGSLALDREFGIDWSFLDMPMDTAKAMIESEIVTKTRRYETRARVERVIWDGNAVSGLLTPKVVITLV